MPCWNSTLEGIPISASGLIPISISKRNDGVINLDSFAHPQPRRYHGCPSEKRGKCLPVVPTYGVEGSVDSVPLLRLTPPQGVPWVKGGDSLQYLAQRSAGDQLQPQKLALWTATDRGITLADAVQE
ncbi:outer membrane lipoprotein carrier protein LolA [Anopheles sinensis]|uniref:Outer membrane lipoprotein carrier protein LolA n=1 Tax=Anopheles sinensis TaxID=74873 RepID=A0A084WCG3_ANOSI|nr:outer membrane lipoprotein carrier protein LolA [Anopheles sinensis]